MEGPQVMQPQRGFSDPYQKPISSSSPRHGLRQSLQNQLPQSAQRDPRDLLMRGPLWLNRMLWDGLQELLPSRPPSRQEVIQNDISDEELGPLESTSSTAHIPSASTTSRLKTAQAPVQAPSCASTYQEVVDNSIVANCIQGNVVTGPVHGTVNMNINFNKSSKKLVKKLKASLKADYRYYPVGDENALRRSCCTPGTRESILREIIAWVISYSSDSAIVYWLAGHAGTGKSTITNTICHMLDSAAVIGDNGGRSVVGGSFFCSRQFLETRDPVWIVRTIVYQLALKSKAFKDALMECEGFEAVDHSPKLQLLALLVEPWEKSTSERLASNEPAYVVPIDALDELDKERGSDFLRTLFDIVKEHKLPGLKFLVTSRLDPELVQQVESFDNKQVCRLEEVRRNWAWVPPKTRSNISSQKLQGYSFTQLRWLNTSREGITRSKGASWDGSSLPLPFQLINLLAVQPQCWTILLILSYVD